MCLLGAIAVVILVILEKQRTIRPSSLISTYLTAGVLADIIQLRTLTLRGYVPSIVILLSLSVAGKLVALVLESLPKRSHLEPAKVGAYGPEELTGIFGRLVFWWLNPLFLRGSKSLLTLDDLGPLDRELLSGRLQKRVQVLWEKSNDPSHFRWLTANAALA